MIYGFRGVDIKQFYRFIRENNFKEYKLLQNYRSTQSIVKASSSLIRNNEDRMNKRLFSQNPVGEAIGCRALNSATEEARCVATFISRLVNHGFKRSDIAILYRMSYLSKDLEDALLKAHIPYEIVNGTAFYGRMEIKDILSYLRFVANPMDCTALKRALNTPARGLGETSIEKILATYTKTCNSLSDNGIIDIESFVQALLDSLEKTSGLRGKGKQGLQNFIAIVKQLREFSDGNTPRAIVEKAIDLTQYIKYVEEKLDNAEERIANLDKLKEISGSYDTLQEFLEGIVMNSDGKNTDDETDNQDCVQMLTMHASKGLEWPVVIIVGANEGIVPHVRAIESGDVEEERRLFYVAMTRAKQYLFITRPKNSVVRGKMMHFEESRFVGEIDQKYVHRA